MSRNKKYIKNKRKKQRLRTALIMLIILFILCGLGGMLFVSHKNQVEKEQRKAAAMAVLDNAGTDCDTYTVTDTGSNDSSCV